MLFWLFMLQFVRIVLDVVLTFVVQLHRSSLICAGIVCAARLVLHLQIKSLNDQHTANRPLACVCTQLASATCAHSTCSHMHHAAGEEAVTAGAQGGAHQP